MQIKKIEDLTSEELLLRIRALSPLCGFCEKWPISTKANFMRRQQCRLINEYRAKLASGE